MNVQRQKIVRYIFASVFNVLLGMGLLVVGFDLLRWSAFISNLAAVLVGTGPMYAVSRRWVWRSTGPSRFYAEVLPFWTLTLIGWAFSSGAVVIVSHIGSDLHLRRDLETLLVLCSAMTAYGLVWILRFFVLDRTVFAPQEIAELIPDPAQVA